MGCTSGVTSSVPGHQASLHSKDSNVKFSIKSFRVPEKFIEVSQIATVGSLKYEVIEKPTLNTWMQGGLDHISVLFVNIDGIIIIGSVSG